MVLAVDEFNGCFNPTTLKTPQKEWVRTSVASILHFSPPPPPHTHTHTHTHTQVVPEQLNLVRAILRHVPQVSAIILYIA